MQPFSAPCRVPSTIENCIDKHSVTFQKIIDGEREPFRQQSVIASRNYQMNPAKEPQRIDVGKKRINKVTAETWRLSFIETVR